MGVDLSLNLGDIPTEGIPVGEYTEDEKQEIREKYLQIKARFDDGHELTLEDQKVIIDFARSDREEKFFLHKKTAKAGATPKVRKAKKLSRANLLLLLQKKEDLSEDEVKDRDNSLELYKGRKISRKNLNLLLVAEARGEPVNILDIMDKNLALYGDANVDQSNLT